MRIRRVGIKIILKNKNTRYQIILFNLILFQLAIIYLRIKLHRTNQICIVQKFLFFKSSILS